MKNIKKQIVLFKFKTLKFVDSKLNSPNKGFIVYYRQQDLAQFFGNN